LPKTQGLHPETITTDKLSSCRAAAKALNLQDRHRPGGMRENNRVENSHLPIRRRERKVQKFKSKAQPSAFSSFTPPSATPSIPSDPPTDAPPVPGRGASGVGGSDRRSV